MVYGSNAAEAVANAVVKVIRLKLQINVKLKQSASDPTHAHIQVTVL